MFFLSGFKILKNGINHINARYESDSLRKKALNKLEDYKRQDLKNPYENIKVKKLKL